MHTTTRVPWAAAILAASLCATGALAETKKNAEVPNASWGELREMMFDTHVEIADGQGIIALDTPYRAHDAAIVPVSVEIRPPSGTRVKTFTILVEENPAPLAATFTPGDAMGEVIRLSTRVRVDAYTNLRVIAEMQDGSFYQVANYVKAAGGCSAPSLKDAEAALANVGKMKLRLFEQADVTSLIKSVAAGAQQSIPADAVREAQVMVRHPNYSGFQMNQVTQLFIPAYFIDDLEVTQGGETLFRMEGGISISEDPAIRFHFTPNGDAPIRVRAHDTEGDEYTREFPVDLGI